jgi:hypothetical protein
MSVRPRLAFAAIVVLSLVGALAVPSAAMAAKTLTSTPAPIVSGTAERGFILTSTTAPWAPATVTKTYQWTRNGTAIAGATKSSYKLTLSDAGKTVRLVVTGKKSGYTTVSKKSDGVVVLKYTKAPQMKLGGEPVPGGQIGPRSIEWAPVPDSLVYQWSRDGVPVVGATSASYTPVESDLDSVFSLSVTATKAGFPTVVRTSGGIEIVRRIVLSHHPEMTGGDLVGDELGIEFDTTPADATLSFRWTRSGKTIADATSRNYTMVDKDLGRFISAFVTVSKDGYLTKTYQVMGGRAGHKTMIAGQPSISGPVVLGQRLTVDIGDWFPTNITFRYEWFVDGHYYGYRTKPYVTVTDKIAAGSEIYVRVIGTKRWWGSERADSNTIAY